MSIEKRTDKLDLKLSSLIRNMGLVTTLTFGLLALIINYSLINWFISLILVGLLLSYFINIIYILIIFTFSSSRKDRFIYELNTLKQLNEIVSEMYNEYRRNFISLGSDFESEEIFLALEYTRTKMEDLKNAFRELLVTINAELPQDGELPYYKIKSRNIADLSDKLQAIIAFIYNHVLLEHGSYLGQESEEIMRKEQKQAISFINNSYLFYEIVTQFCLDLNYYSELEISELDIANLMFLNPYYTCNYLIDYSKQSIYKKFIEISSKKNEIINSYSKNIRRPYYLYIFSFVVLCILMLYFAISIFFL